MNRKKRAGKPAKGSARKKVDWKALEIVHPDAAGIDVGGSEHWAAISPRIAIKRGHQYVDKGTAYYEDRYREQQIRSLKKRAQKLGLQVVFRRLRERLMEGFWRASLLRGPRKACWLKPPWDCASE